MAATTSPAVILMKNGKSSVDLLMVNTARANKNVPTNSATTADVCAFHTDGPAPSINS